MMKNINIKIKSVKEDIYWMQEGKEFRLIEENKYCWEMKKET